MVNANVTDKCTRLACPLLQNMKTESDGRKIDILKQLLISLMNNKKK